jgi:hypothetical protein
MIHPLWLNRGRDHTVHVAAAEGSCLAIVYLTPEEALKLAEALRQAALIPPEDSQAHYVAYQLKVDPSPN